MGVAVGAFHRRRRFLFCGDGDNLGAPFAVVGIGFQRVDAGLVGGDTGVMERHEGKVLFEEFVGVAGAALAFGNVHVVVTVAVAAPEIGV